MSRVTNLLLHINALETAPASGKILEVNQFFERNDKHGLVSLDASSLPRGWYGGDKMLEANLYVGAFNFLDLEAFLEHIRSLAWQEGDQVQAIVMKQEEDKFHIIDVINSDGAQTPMP